MGDCNLEGFISNEFAKLIGKIPDQDYDMESILNVFREYIPAMASRYNIRYCKAVLAEPQRGFHGAMTLSEREVVLFDDRVEPETNDYIAEFKMGNGGYVKVISGIDKNCVWTDMMKSESFIMARTVYLLMGRARAMKELMRLTFQDSLTGVGNEARLYQYISELIDKQVFHHYHSNFINIKNMKLMNNRFSDRGGDRIIILYSHHLNEFVGNDGLVVRLGGDNFFVLIKDEREQDFLNHMKEVVVEFNTPDGTSVPVHVDARIGYYNIKEHDRHREAMRKSDIALIVCRKTNASVVEFQECMSEKMMRNKALEENFPSAIENREFVVFYQPKADISNGDEFKLCGAEALVRWKKDGSIIPPLEFISLLENNGMINNLDFYVFDTICSDIREALDAGYPVVRISSNFSRRHLADANFANKIESIMKKHNVDAKYIEVEITESYDADDNEALKSFEQRMHALGVQVSVDDFGSGFSSIRMVKDIVADTIKIDKSIIDGVGQNEGDHIIVSHVIKMIKELGKDVIAEGVETKEQADLLLSFGCDKIQGYLFGRPMPKEEFVRQYFVRA